jgi:predicted small metal-binding protein
VKIRPEDALDLNLAEMQVRSETTLDLLLLACGALAECGFRAARTDDEEEIAEHVAATLDVIQGRVRALHGQDVDDAD